jgi:hypothetical protein
MLSRLVFFFFFTHWSNFQLNILILAILAQCLMLLYTDSPIAAYDSRRQANKAMNSYDDIDELCRRYGLLNRVNICEGKPQVYVKNYHVDFRKQYIIFIIGYITTTF